jgi:putative heme-binding domain-containing protein
MSRPLALLSLILALPALADTRLVRETAALSPTEEHAQLHVPAGFEIQLFASEPMINKPINIAFDARGRLWVSSTVEYPYSADKTRWSDPQGTQVKDSRDAIKILEDTDGDGKADKVTDFADGLNIPTGVLPWHKPEHHAGCIAFSIPNIWYFADTDGDGKADLREILFGPLGYEKDTHGMCSSFRLGLDGWVYATHGFNNTSTFRVQPQHRQRATENSEPGTLELHSGNVFRFRPDGSAVELWSAGQVNPFGLAWDRYGNLYSADCHSSPVYQLLRGAHYPSFGKPHDGLGFAPVMCQHTHGSTGICGIVYIDGGVWGPEWDDHLFLGNVVTSKINHDHVTFTGSTPKANEQPDFLTSDDPWFRPVDLTLGPDNALYIADFYNRIIGHYEVPLDHPGRDRERGRIWRIVKTQRPVLQAILSDSEATQILALRTLAETPTLTPEQTTTLLDQLTDASPKISRTAAEIMQLHPTLSFVQPLIHKLQNTSSDDPSLVHVLKIALRENLRQPAAFASPKPSPLLSSIALAVPTAEAATYLLNNADLSLPETQSHLARHLPEAALPKVIAILREHTAPAVSSIETVFNALLERGLPPPPELLAWAQATASELLAKVRQQPEPKWTPIQASTKPPAWTLRPRKLPDGAERPTLQSMNTGGEEERRTGTLRSQPFPAPSTLAFKLCGHRGPPDKPAHDRNLVRLIDDDGKSLRSAFPSRSDTLQLVTWDLTELAGQNVRLEIVDGDSGKAYAWLGITDITPAVLSVETFQAHNETHRALTTLATLLRTTAPVSLRDQLAPYLPPSPAPPPTPVSPEQRAALDQLIATRLAAFEKAKPDLEIGANVFKMNCAACHQIAGEGGLIGPQLDGIGTRGAARLIEDILDPNRNVDAHFRLHLITRKDGSTFSGFLKAEVGQVLILADAAGAETRLSKADIQEDTVLPNSLMPPTFGDSIEASDFADLLAWLLKQAS